MLYEASQKKIQWIRNIFLGSPEKTEISLNISFRDILQVTKTHLAMLMQSVY